VPWQVRDIAGSIPVSGIGVFAENTFLLRSIKHRGFHMRPLRSVLRSPRPAQPSSELARRVISQWRVRADGLGALLLKAKAQSKPVRF
jgi:hypothetical protein